MVTVELCVDDTNGVRIAREAGVHRVELCASLDVGGLTPEFSLITECLSEAPVGGLQVIVRSRAGDFVYSREEISAMCDDIRAIRRLTGDSPVPVGFVVGAVTEDGCIDEDAAAAYRQAAGTRPLTFHRAFDVLADQMAGVETLVALGYQRVLTTGGDPAVAQVSALRKLTRVADGRLKIIASGGVRSGNVAQIVADSAAPEVHMRAPASGADGGTDSNEVARIMAALR